MEPSFPAPVRFVLLPLLTVAWLLIAISPRVVAPARPCPPRAAPVHGSERANALQPRDVEGTLWSLVDHVAAARVTVTRGPATETCRPQIGGRHRCGTEDWAFVGPYGDKIGGRSAGCVWVHPVADGSTTRIEVPEVRFGGHIELRVGLLDGAGPGADLQVAVRSGNNVLARGSVAKDGPPQVTRAPTETLDGTSAPLTVEVTARENRWRLGCIDVLAREGPLEPSPTPTGGRR